MGLAIESKADPNFGDPAGSKTLEETTIGQLQSIEDLANWIKTEDEVSQYFRCHLKVEHSLTSATFREVDRNVNNRLAEFRTFKEPFIDLAVQAFQIPFPLSGCIMFRETFFDNSRVSSADARTIAQFTPKTYEELIKQYKNVRDLSKDYSDFQDIKLKDALRIRPRDNKNPFVRWEQFRQRKGPYYEQASEEQKQIGHDISEARLSNFLIHKGLIANLKVYLWLTSNHPSINRSQLFPGAPKGKYPRGTDLMPPTNFNRFIRNKMWVSAYNIYYLKQMVLQANALFQPDGFKGDTDPLSYLMIIAGSYNQGPAKLKALVQRKPHEKGEGSRSLKRWCQILSETPETKNYMLSVRRCLTKGIFAQPTNSPRGECQGSSAFPQTTDPCETIQPIQTLHSPARDNGETAK